MTQPFRFGVQAGGTHTPDSFAALARRAEELGYSTLYFPDHFVDTELAPMVAMAVAASVTTTLRVGALVFDNDYKHPAVLAKEAATIDVLAGGGRVVLGIGAGWMEVDYTALGLAYDRPGVRIERLEEALAVVKGCLGSGAFSHAGAHYTITDYDATPTPTGSIPILVGGGGPRVLRLAGREADIVGINPNMRAGAVTPDAVTDSLAAMTDRKVGWIREGAGDRFDDLDLQIRYFLASVTDNRRGLAEAMAPGFGITADDALEAGIALVGTEDEICALMESRRERWSVNEAVVGGDEMEMFAPVVERLAGK
jgi:probable F420-dependent oxidoreductase